jgi:hypothetical protein
MRRLGLNVKRLARGHRIWHRAAMAKDAADKERIKAERLREALRANLRRRKVPNRKASAVQSESGTESES